MAGHNCGFPGNPHPISKKEKKQTMREFDTGATRDEDDSKLDYEGFLSPLALRRYAEYMHKHRKQADGEVRASDNWQKGIPFTAYAKSLWRHLVEFWTEHRAMVCPTEEYDYSLPDNREEILCAIIFNASGYLHELIKEERTNLEN